TGYTMLLQKKDEEWEVTNIKVEWII
ncbi:MAG: hypothetical protein ACI86M_003452, partial [Saprospiraceae bacterium]